MLSFFLLQLLAVLVCQGKPIRHPLRSLLGKGGRDDRDDWDSKDGKDGHDKRCIWCGTHGHCFPCGPDDSPKSGDGKDGHDMESEKSSDCPPVCKIYCEYGNVQDADGCDLCECHDAPADSKDGKDDHDMESEGGGGFPPLLEGGKSGDCPVFRCMNNCDLHGFRFDKNGCQDKCNCDCPPVCEIFCEFGNVQDADGCDLCECHDAPKDTGCCFVIGIGAENAPCCLQTRPGTSETQCSWSPGIVGGEHGWAPECPADEKEAKAIIDGNKNPESAGCCFVIGSGAENAPCCLQTRPGTTDEQCKMLPNLLGGEHGWAPECPADADEAKVIINERDGCCFVFGLGAGNVPCCLDTLPGTSAGVCSTLPSMMGGERGWAPVCPADADEAKAIVDGN